MLDHFDPKLVQLACDGELTPEQAADLDQFIASHPEAGVRVRQHIENVRTLRQHVNRTICSACPGAPSDLVLSVRAALDDAEAAPRRLQRSERGVLRFLFAEPHRANVLAVAATLALIAGAVLFGIFGRSIDDHAPPSALDLVSDAALFADQEHRVCASNAGKVDISIVPADPVQAELDLSSRLGGPVQVFDLSRAGYQFVGSDQCDMPVPARSGHLIYRKMVEDGQRAPMLSVFVVRDQGRCGGKLCEGLDVGKWCCVSESGVKCKRKVLRGTDGQLVYFLVCCVDGDLDKVAQQIQLASSAPGDR